MRPWNAPAGRDVRERPGGVNAPLDGQARAMEWMTLVSAGVGAIIATASAAVLERGRWRRENRERETAVRRVLYGEYLACLSKARNGFRSLARATVPRRMGEAAAGRPR